MKSLTKGPTGFHDEFAHREAASLELLHKMSITQECKGEGGCV